MYWRGLIDNVNYTVLEKESDSELKGERKKKKMRGGRGRAQRETCHAGEPQTDTKLNRHGILYLLQPCASELCMHSSGDLENMK